MDTTSLRAAVRNVPDFPQPGILFKDITPILADATLFHQAVSLLCATAGNQPIQKVVGIDARGFIFAAAVADRLGVGFIPVRKKGKLPWLTHESSYSLEYGHSTVEIHQDAIQPNENVLLIDDLLATGGTAAAAAHLLTQLGATITTIAVLIELTALKGREKLSPHPVTSIISY